jgi:hypothetical protein
MNALPLFDFALANRLKTDGMAQVAAHAPIYSALAYAALVRIARRQLVLHADDLIAELNGLKPPHPNAIGPCWQRAVHEGLIQRTNQVRASHDPVKRARMCPVYFSLVYRSV